MLKERGGQAGASGMLEVLIALFLVFIVGITLFNNTILENNALLNMVWTLGVPIAAFVLLLKGTGIIR